LLYASALMSLLALTHLLSGCGDYIMSAQHALQALDENERLVYEIVLRATEASGGIFQVKLKELPELKHLEPQQIARIVSRLVKKGLLKRKLVNNNGKSMYFLQAIVLEPAPKVEITRKISINIPIDTGLFATIPCFQCKDLFNCGEGNPSSPLKCPILTSFLARLSSTDSKP